MNNNSPVSGSRRPSLPPPPDFAQKPLSAFISDQFNMVDFSSNKPLTAADLRKTREISEKDTIQNDLHKKVNQQLNVDNEGKANLYKLCSAVFLLIHDFCAQEQIGDNKSWSIFGSARRDSNIKYNIYLKGILQFLKNNVNEGFTIEDAYNLCILFTHTKDAASTNSFTNHGENFVKDSLGVVINKDAIVGDIKTLQDMRKVFSAGRLLPELDCLTKWENEENKSNSSEEVVLSNVSGPQGNDEVKTSVGKSLAELAIERRTSLKKVESAGSNSPIDQVKMLSEEDIAKLSVSQRAKYFDSLNKKPDDLVLIKLESEENKSNSSEEVVLSNVSGPQGNDKVKTSVDKSLAELAIERRTSLKKVESAGSNSSIDQVKMLSEEDIAKLSVSQRAKYFDSLNK